MDQSLSGPVKTHGFYIKLGLDMPFWRKIVNDYREGFHGVISQPKSPKIANFGKPSENCLQ